MSTYPDLKNEPDLLKIKTKDDQLKELQYRTEKHDFDNILNTILIMNLIKRNINH